MVVLLHTKVLIVAAAQKFRAFLTLSVDRRPQKIQESTMKKRDNCQTEWWMRPMMVTAAAAVVVVGAVALKNS